jgi:3-oxoacyl-[acyl-carrier protein] reductase
MVTVLEEWYLRPDVLDRGVEIMQEMDDLVGPPAHEDPGWAGHAHFYRRHESPSVFVMIYPWRAIDDHLLLRDKEEPMLTPFYEKYCTAPRKIWYFEELAVEVEHD